MARLFFRNPCFAVLDECTDAVSVDVEEKLYRAAVEMGITPAKRHGFERWWPDDAPTEDLVPLKK